ncbi:EHN domain-containing protein [Mycena indigotica]|uniref:EHN domain-containing protein n=1 Tax=Mycena indigotica TaxID=2126181 RepID=A0A8H6W705_9AGAR|nr:EHN domain-containing protein [Mycena indigotica]KAF7303963.1 EHN domain-containing protein [Mycena indigotica]
MGEQPFQINVSDEHLTLLKAKLDLSAFPDELDEAGWAYGAPLTDLKRLVKRWKDGYDWRKHEKALNDELPQFTRDIEVDGFGSLNIHYVHIRSGLEDAIPLLFVHGWPGSFFEIRKMGPLLAQVHPDHPSFHVVAISLPGYGFSEAPKKKGFNSKQYAEVCHKLMLALGYNEYVTQGGDWGGIILWITRKLAVEYGGEHAKAWHTNFPVVGPPRFSWNPFQVFTSASMLFALLWMTPEEKAGLQQAQSTQRHELGYFQMQTTKPQTLGYSLADSPVGLLAWIYEKLVRWTDKYPWDDDEVLTWISIYWFSRAGPAASLRIYYEIAQERGLIPSVYDPTTQPSIPMGITYFPGEIFGLPRKRVTPLSFWSFTKQIYSQFFSWVRRTGNVVFESAHPMGGHFGAYEAPALLADDLRKMFGRNGPAYGVVPKRVGYAARSRL